MDRPSPLERRAAIMLAAVIVLHLAVWATLPAMLYQNLPLDLIEALTYGREWQLGYDKLPPLPWWLVEIVYRVFRVEFAFYALAQLAVIACFLVMWVTARPLVGPVGALAAILIIDGQHYFNYTAAKFNHDVIQLPLWALAGWAFLTGLRTNRVGPWVVLGLSLGLALWAKYFVVILAVPLALFLLLDRQARRALATPGPWLAVVTALVVAAPHLVWLVKNDFLPFAYAGARAAQAKGLLDHIKHPLLFAGSQLAFLAPALLIAAPLVWPRAEPSSRPVSDLDRRVLTMLAFGPVAMLLAASVITGRGLVAMWGYPLWIFLGLWIVVMTRTAIDATRLKRMIAAWAFVFVGFAVAFVINYAVLVRSDHRYRATSYPGERLALELSERFRAATGRPLLYVIGTMWDGGNVAHYSPDHPRVLIDGNPRRAPWIDLSDLRARGAIVVWTDGDATQLPARFAAVAAGAQPGPPFRLPYRQGDKVLDVGWAIVRPAPTP